VSKHKIHAQGDGRRKPDGCTPRAGRDIHLPVLSSENPSGVGARKRNKVAHSKMSWWRAGALTLVHVLIGVHVWLWIRSGVTVSPVEPSESMYTLETGAINAGFVFFAVSILLTLFFGRLVCGWACHVIALQDACSWMLGKVGVRPRAFRSRLLIYAPLGLALYMFVWPTFKRVALVPLLGDERGKLPWILQAPGEFPGLHPEFIVEEFWATFPPLYVAIPFLFVCGFAIVYALGAKGFCTYGCPYGGFFAPADLVAPMKIRVNENCNQCGHCTGVCTSNVRVHEEVRDYGMVVDPGCMKCFDCISVCPNDALSYGLGKPSLLAAARDVEAQQRINAIKANPRRFDLSAREEWAFAAIFLGLLIGFRGFLNVTPLLMAAGLAGIGVFVALKLWRVLTVPNVRFHTAQLRLRGRLTMGGFIFITFAAIYLALGAWGLAVGSVRWQANLAYNRLQVPLDVTSRPEFSPGPSSIELARRSASLKYRSGLPTMGGFGWTLSGQDNTHLAYLHTLLDEPDKAEASIRRLINEGSPSDEAVFALANLLASRGLQWPAIEAELLEIVERHPRLLSIRSEIARNMVQRGDREAALVLMRKAVELRPRHAQSHLELARLHAAMQDRDAALAGIERTLEEARKRGSVEVAAARLLAVLGERERAIEVAKIAAERPPRSPDVMLSAAELLVQLGQREQALELAATAVERTKRRLGPVTTAARLHAALGQPDRAAEYLKVAGERAGDHPWDVLAVGSVASQLAFHLGRQDLATLAVELAERALILAPDEPLILHDAALARLSQGRAAHAADAMTKAAEIGTMNAVLADRAADLHENAGNTEASARWRAEAQRRRAALTPVEQGGSVPTGRPG